MPRKKKDETIEPTAVEETAATAAAPEAEPEVVSQSEDELLFLTEAETPSETLEPAADPPPEKKKRAPRKKKEPKPPPEESPKPPAEALAEEPIKPPPALVKKTPRQRARPPDVLTIESGTEVETEQHREDTAWHEIHNAYRTRKILTGTLDGIEQNEAGKSIAIVHYNGYRVLIPTKEMMLNLRQNSADWREYEELMRRQNKIMGNMLGAEIDFVVKGIDSRARSVVASRREAMLKKRQLFYLRTDDYGQYRIHEGRVVQARVIAVADKVVRVGLRGGVLYHGAEPQLGLVGRCP